jgi:hypothetical protein
MKLKQMVLTWFLWSCALAGALKYLGLLAGFPIIHLIPKAVLAVVVLWPFISLRASRLQWLILVSFALSFSIALLNGLSVKQSLFGMWVLLPLLFGLIHPSLVLSRKTRKSLSYIVAISIAGELLNYFVTFPWENMTLTFGDYTSNVSRQWMDNSVRRLAGFTTSSIDLSIIIAMAACAMLAEERRPGVRSVILTVCCFAILATTMKTAAAAFLMAALPLWSNFKSMQRAACLAALVVSMVAVFAPFAMWSTHGAFGTFVIRNFQGEESLQTRFDAVWPAVLDYLAAHHVGVMGLGVGGLGAANDWSNAPFEYAFVDNMYLYLIGTGGIMGGVLIAVLCGRLALRSLTTKPLRLDMAIASLVFFAIYGISQSAVETSVGALFIGASVATRGEPKRIIFRGMAHPSSPVLPWPMMAERSRFLTGVHENKRT